MRITLVEDSPFAFDQDRRLRCLRCRDPYIVADGHRLGSNKKEKLDSYGRKGRRKLPPGWTSEGEIDRLDGETWKTLVEQNWRVALHCETQRLGYVSLYGGISVISPILALTLAKEDSVRAILFSAIGIYTIVHYLITSKYSQSVSHHVDHIGLLTALAPRPAEPGMGWSEGGFLLRGVLPEPIAKKIDANGGKLRTLLAGGWMPQGVSDIVATFYGLLAVAWLGSGIVFGLKAIGVH